MSRYQTIYDGRQLVAALEDPGPRKKLTVYTIDERRRWRKIGRYGSRALALRALRQAVPPTRKEPS